MVATCKVCSTPISGDRVASDCSICVSTVCNLCCEVYVLKSLNETRARAVCTTCKPKLRGEITKLRSRNPIDLSLFTVDERDRVESGKLPCALCHSKFSAFAGPHRCGTCSDIICFKCCFDFADAPQLVSMKSGTVCRACWGGWRKKFAMELKTAKAASDSDYVARLGEELSLGDRFLAELQSSDIKHPLEAKGKTLESVKEAGACPHCSNAFGVWLSPTQCSRCDKIVCSGKSCSQYFAQLAGTRCRTCWGESKQELQRAVLRTESESAASALNGDISGGTYFFETVTPQQYYAALRDGKPLTHGTSSLNLSVKRRAITSACKLCHEEFDTDKHRWKTCSECKEEVCMSCSNPFVLKSAGETASRIICKRCEHVVRAKLGKLAAPEMPQSSGVSVSAAAAAASSSTAASNDDDILSRLLNPTLYGSTAPAEATKASKSGTAEDAGTRMAMLRIQTKALLSRSSVSSSGSRISLRPGDNTSQSKSLAALQQKNFFDSLSTQVWSHIAASLPPSQVRPLASTNRVMRDILSGWTSLHHFDEKALASMRRVGVVPGINPQTSHVGHDEIVSLHFGLGTAPTFQIYRFRPTVEPRFEATLGANAPKFGLGTTLSSDGSAIVVRSRSSTDAGKPVVFSLFKITRAAGAGNKITGVPFVGTATSQGTRGVVETVHRAVLYAAFFDKAEQRFVVESFSCDTGKLVNGATHPASIASAKVHAITVEARHLYLLVADASTEQPFQLVSFTLDLVFEASLPLDAMWNSTVYLRKHHAIYFDAKAKAIREVAMSIDHARINRIRTYALKLKRNEEVRSLMMDSSRMVVITSADQAHIFARSREALISTVKLPFECVEIQPFQSHIVVITPVKLSKSVKMLVSPRGGSSSGGDKAQSTQAEVFHLGESK